MPIPAQFQTVMPYLILNNAIQFISFMEKVFDAKVEHIEIQDETTLRHAQLKIGNATIMCGSANEEWKPLQSSLFIYVDNADDSYAKAIKNGCTTIMELSDQEYGRTCGVKDAYGNIWWITSV